MSQVAARTDDESALLAAVVQRPDDDLPRLVYADFIEELGQAERAEFIRLQCDLARRPPTHPDRPALQARTKALLHDHKQHWQIAGLRGQQLFRRGFVEQVAAAADWLLETAEDEFEGVPLRHLRIGGADHRLTELARMPILSRIETLDLRNNNFGVPGRMELFFQHADLERCRSLILRNNRIWPDTVSELLRVPVVTRLQRLDLSGNPVESEGLERIAVSPAVSGLRELILDSHDLPYSYRIKAAGADAIRHSTTLTGLRQLSLAGHDIGDAGLIDLAVSANSQFLEELNLDRNQLGSLGSTSFEHLTTSPHFARLRRLNLAGAAIDRLAAAELAGWPQLAHLELLDLRAAQFGPGAAQILRECHQAERILLDQPEGDE